MKNKLKCSIAFIILLCIIITSCFTVVSAESGNKDVMTCTAKKSFVVTWEPKDITLGEEDVSRLDVAVTIYDAEAKGREYTQVYDYAELESIEIINDNEQTSIKTSFYPVKEDVIYLWLMLDGEAIQVSKPIAIESAGFWESLKLIGNIMFIYPINILTETRLEFFSSDNFPVLFTNGLNLKTMSDGMLIAGVVIILVLLFAIGIILKIVQFDKSDNPMTAIFSYIWWYNFMLLAILKWDENYNMFNYELGYTMYGKKVIMISSGIILLLITGLFIWWIFKGYFRKCEIIGFIVTGIFMYLIFHTVIFALIIVGFFVGLYMLIQLFRGMGEAAAEIGYEIDFTVDDPNESIHHERNNGSWYDNRAYVYDEYGNQLKVGTSGDYAQDSSGEWHKVHRRGDGSPYIQGNSEKHDLY